MCGCIWTPPDRNSRLDWDRWSQLLTYIRLRDAAGQRLRREPRWVFARFHLNGPKTSAEAVPVHTSGSGSDGVTVSPSLAFLLQLPRWDLLFLYGPVRPLSSTVPVHKRYCPRASPRRFSRSCWQGPPPQHLHVAVAAILRAKGFLDPACRQLAPGRHGHRGSSACAGIDRRAY